MSKKLIQALEPRIMLDGAAVATAIDVFDELNQDQQQQQEQSSKTDKFKTEEGTKLPFVNVDSSAQQTRTKQIAFIDSAVQDFEILANSFDENTEVHIIQSNEDGFETIENILSDQSNIDAIHIIGHGSAGQIAFGTALLNNVSLENYRTTLTSIGNSLTSKGDILFYGCNIADGRTGEILIKQISEITNADIAASDDITGKGGDWDLEKHTGIIEARNIEVVNYQHSLITGVDSYDSSVVVNNSSSVNFKNSAQGGYQDPSSDRFVLVQERADVTSGTGTLNFDVSGSHSSYTPSSSNPVHVYMLFSNDNTDSNSRRTGSRTGVVTFDNAIIGVFTTPSNTVAMSGVSQASGTFPTSGSSNFGKRDLEFNGNAAGPGSEGSKDWFEITNSNKTIEIGTKNGQKGDFIRIITEAPVSNTAPVARNDAGYINEDATLTVANGANANDTTPDASGEYTGDVINTSSSTHADTDADGDTLTVASIRTGSSENNGTAGSLGSYLPGTYGSLRIYANGSYDYIANDDDADALDPGDTVTDSFNYTISDGNGGTDHAVITITIAGVNDDITAVNDTDAVNEDATITRSTSDSQELDHDDTDPDGDDASGSFTITAIRTKRESDSDGVGGTVGSALNGTYGVLTVESDGSYEYVASTSGADGLTAGATAVDYFTYTVRDHNSGDTDTAELAITVTGVGPQAVADTGSVNENATLTVNEASGVIANDDDNASYDSESLAVTRIVSDGTSNAGNATQEVVGTYGALTMAADGSYEYVANQSAADALDPGDQVTDVFTYTLKDDADKNSSTATLTITVTGINDDITAVNDTDAVNAGSTITRSTSDTQELDHDDTDPDADDVSGSFTITSVRKGAVENSGDTVALGQAVTTTYGTITVNADGSYTYAADQTASTNLGNGVTATDSFNYTVRDHNSGDTDIATLVITITGTNNTAPVANADAGYILEDGQLEVTDGASANDATPDATGEHTGDVLLDDTDADGDTLTVSGISGGSVGSAADGTYGQLTIQSNGSYVYVANKAAADALDDGDTATDVFTYTISDGNNGSDTATITITVVGIDDNPVGVNDTGAVDEDATLSVNSGSGVLSNDTDADDSSSLTVSAISGGTVGQALTGTYGTLTLNSNGSYSYVANTSGADGLAASATATDTFTYTVSDGAGTTDTATLTVTVTGVGPQAVADTGAVNENATLTVNEASGVIANDDDNASYDTESLAVTNISSNGTSNSGNAAAAVTGTYGVLTMAADGSYSYVANTAAAEALDASDEVTDVFTYTLKDDADKNSSTATLTITVTGVNDNPIAVDDTDSVNEDATITRTVNDAQELDADDTDADTDDAQGSFTITAIRTGTESATDGNGGTIGQALTGTYGTLTVNADGSYTYVADQNAADNLATGATATDVFTYTVSDGTATDTGQISVTVTGINDNNPVAVDDTDSVNRDATITRAADSAFDINADDTDADGESLTITEIRVGQSEGGGRSGEVGSALVGEYGTLTLNSDGSYTYAADQDSINNLKRGESRIEYFNYTVSDGTNTDVGVIAITVNGISDPPVPVDDTVEIDAGVTTTKEGSESLVSNDTDPDGDTLTVDSIRTGQESGTGTTGTIGSPLTGTYGDITVNENGSYTYDANNAKSLNPGETVTEYFTYTATDGETPVSAQIAITVTGVNDPPEVTNPITVPTLFTGQKLVIRHPQAFEDPDSGSFDIQTYTVIDPETEQETSLPEGLNLRANKLTGRPTEPGTYSITLRATDGGGLYVDHTFTFTVITRPGETVDPDKTTKKPKQVNEVVKVRPQKDNQPVIAEPRPVESVVNEGFTLDTVKIADTASLSKPLKFNGGLRLMDAIADTSTSTENSDLKVGVKINDDNQKNVELYSGKLSNGKALPDWIKVNPETGETTAEMPDGTDEVEVQLVALDKDGNTRDISIVLDKNKIKNDKNILRTGEMNQTRLFVDSDSNVNVIRENDGKVNETASNNLNANADFTGNLRLSDVRMGEGKYVLNVIDDNQSNVKSYTAVMKDGEALPSWISIDPKTGAISADPSKNINNSSVPSFIADAPTVLELKIVAEDEDGKERVIDVEVNLEELTTEQTDTEESNEESEEISFVPLQDQINQQIQQSDNYGEEFISRVG